MSLSRLAFRWQSVALFGSCLSLAQCAPATTPIVRPPAQVATSTLVVPEGAPIVRRTAGSPMSLTASDGTGLRLVKITGQSVLQDPLAFTELRLTFENPEDRVLEGRFSITLPASATVSRFAMRIDDVWQEAEVVEKKAARLAYEDFLHRKQDPALLEQGAGNEFTARVFPIPARATKEIILSYSQEVASRSPTIVPLQGLPEIGEIDVQLSFAGKDKPFQAIRKAHYVPAGDFGFDPKAGGQGGVARNGNLVVARIQPLGDAQPDPIESAVVLFDTSASRALGFEDQLRLLDRIVQQLVSTKGSATPLTVACFDQSVEPIYEGPAGGFGSAELQRIRARKALGSSRLDDALAWVQTKASQSKAKRLILMTDGVATAGKTEISDLRNAAARLSSVGIDRLDVVAVGGLRDDSLLRGLVTAGLSRDGIVADSELEASEVFRKLSSATRSGLAVQMQGASWSWPRTLDGVQAGDEVLVYGEVPAGHPISVLVNETAVKMAPTVEVERPLLERAWAKAKISSLLEVEAKEGKRPAISDKITALSIEHRVLSPYTSFLVLETEKDYERFKIDRKALRDILTVEGGRLVTTRRTTTMVVASDVGKNDRKVATDALTTAAVQQPVAAPERAAAPQPAAAVRSAEAPRTREAPSAPWGSEDEDKGSADSASGQMMGNAIGDSYGAGGLGLSGTAEAGGGRGEGIGLGSVGSLGHGAGTGSGQGFGSGSGRLSGSHSSSAPRVRMGATSVNGRLPPEVIQRIVRQNYGRFRLCYERELQINPNLAGRVAVRFVIGKDGSVSAVANANSTMPDTTVVACVVQSFRNLSFPQPDGGIVTVVYPLEFNPSDGGSQSPPRSSYTPPQRPDLPVAETPEAAQPYTGNSQIVMAALADKDTKRALSVAEKWNAESPGNVLALIALGEALEASGDNNTASRAYGSLIDLFPSRADLRRFAGERLERIKTTPAQALAVDTYEKALKERPDHPSSHRLLAFALLKAGEVERAFDVAVAAASLRFPAGRFLGVDRILREDAGLIGAALIKKDPSKRTEVLAALKKIGAKIEDAPSLRFVLNWETDANDVDFHIFDGQGGHAFYSRPKLMSGGELYADVTTGYGPECFTIRKPKAARAAVYTLQANYYSRGPMGYGMGKLQIIDHDGHGGLTFEERPYVVMVDRAFVNLGVVKR